MLVKINNCKLISELVPNKSILNKRIYFGYNYMYKKSETFILSISSMILTSRNGAWDNTSEDGCEITPKNQYAYRIRRYLELTVCFVEKVVQK